MIRMLENLSQAAFARRVVLPVLKASAFNLSIRHPWVPGAKVRLNSFRHKGYGFFGRGREEQTMELFAALITPGATIVEVGGHIGFITTYFASLAGPTGNITVFEPGTNNLPYIRDNIACLSQSARYAPIELVEKAVGDFCGTVEFYEDNLTGQNNSIVEDFKGLKDNAGAAFTELHTEKRVAPITTLDQEMAKHQIDFVKIDVEGFELGVLTGMIDIVERCKPIIMVEVQADEAEIFEYFKVSGYTLYSENRQLVVSPDKLKQNIFALHKVHHGSIIDRVFNF
jgi:FkbM family methyltransferase